MGVDEEVILDKNLKVKSWKDLTNEMQSTRLECQIKSHFPLDFIKKQAQAKKILKTRWRDFEI